MEYINNILGSQSQVQLVEEAIPTLCSRLQHATLVSDRRSAVLGLKSFSRQYRESVVEHGLRPLISTFKKDSENIALAKALLETFLILLIRGEDTEEDATRGWISQQLRQQNGKYPSPLLMEEFSLDQLSLWIADAILQDPEMLSLLIEELTEDDYHLKFYALQLLEFLVLSRSSRAKDVLLHTPTAMSSICAVLNDTNEPVRNEAILLLMALVNNNFNIQKLVAFENTFETLFNIIDEEGGIRGSILVQDCLTLITNLLLYNASNQKYFMETQCVPGLTRLLDEAVFDELAPGSSGLDSSEELNPNLNGALDAPVPMVWTEQRVQNMRICLEIGRLLVAENNELVMQNQDKLFKEGFHYVILKLIFSSLTENSVRATALLTAADAIRGNHNIQYEFSKIDVPYIDPCLPVQTQANNPPVLVPLALLNWCLFINSVHLFDVRISASYCLQAYFKNNQEAKLAFLKDQISAYHSENYYPLNEESNEELNKEEKEEKEEEKKEQGKDKQEYMDMNGHGTATKDILYGNIFKSLMEYDAEVKLNPYKVWFSACVLMYIFEDEPENKNIARAVMTGNENSGEEVMGSIQAMSELLVTTFEDMDQRVSIGYLMLLTTWIFEDFDAVNDFLNDESTVKSILAFLSNNTSETNSIVHGMTAMLLGIAYEFSSKDSPIKRQDLHALLVKSIGMDNYAHKINQLTANPVFKYFDETLNFVSVQDESGLPDVYFDQCYVELMREHMTRIKRALFHDPAAEPRGRISYEVFEEVDMKLAEVSNRLEQERADSATKEALHKLEVEKLTTTTKELQQKLEETNVDLEKVKVELSTVRDKHSTSSKQLLELKKIKEGLEKNHLDYKKELEETKTKISQLKSQLSLTETKLKTTEEAKKKLEDGVNGMTKDLFQLKKQNSEWDNKVKASEKETRNVKNEAEKIKKDLEHRLRKIQEERDVANKVVSESKEEISILKKSITSLELQLANKTVDANKLTMEKDHFAAKIKEQEKQVSLLSGQLQEKSLQFTELESSLTEVKEQKASGDIEVEKLSSKLKRAREDLIHHESEMKEKLDRAKDDIENLEEKIKNFETEIQKKEKELEKHNDLEKQIDRLNTELTNRDEEIKKHQASLSEKEKEVDSKKLLEAKILELEGELKEAKNEALTLKKEHDKTIEDLKQNEKTINEESKVLVKKIAALGSDKKSLQNEISELKEKLSQSEKVQEDLKDLKKQFAELEKSKSKLELDLKSLQKVLDDKSKLERATSNELTDIVEKLKKENLAMEEKISGLEKEVESGTSLRDENQGLKTKIDELEDKIKGLDTDKGKLESTLQEVKVEKAQLDKEIEALTADKKRLNKEAESFKSLQTDNQNRFEKRIDKLEEEKIDLSNQIEKLQEEKNAYKAKQLADEEKITNLSKEKSDALSQLEKLQLDLKSTKEEAKTVSDQNLELEKNILESKTKLDAVFEKVSTLESTNAGLEEEIKNLKQRITSLVPKSEIDDLMLLMADLDEKKNKYAKRLKQLGHEISDDDDSSEDDDDEDDEEDEDE